MSGQSIRLNPYHPPTFAGLEWVTITSNVVAMVDKGYLFKSNNIRLTLPENPIENASLQYKLGEGITTGYLQTTDGSEIKSPNGISNIVTLRNSQSGGHIVYTDGNWEVFATNAIAKKNTITNSAGDEYVPLTEKATRSLFKTSGEESYAGLDSKTIRDTTITLNSGKKIIDLDKDVDLDTVLETGFYRVNGSPGHGAHNLYERYQSDRFEPGNDKNSCTIYFDRLLVLNDGIKITQYASRNGLFFNRHWNVGQTISHRWYPINSTLLFGDQPSKARTLDDYDDPEWMNVNMSILKAHFLNDDEWANLDITGSDNLNSKKFVPTAHIIKDRFIELDPKTMAKHNSSLDLNEYTTTGFYYVVSATNAPVNDTTFFVRVLTADDDKVLQEIFPLGQNNGWFRSYDGSAWTPWKLITVASPTVHKSTYSSLKTAEGSDNWLLSEKAIHALFVNDPLNNGEHYGLTAAAIHSLIDSLINGRGNVDIVPAIEPYTIASSGGARWTEIHRANAIQFTGSDGSKYKLHFITGGMYSGMGVGFDKKKCILDCGSDHNFVWWSNQQSSYNRFLVTDQIEWCEYTPKIKDGEIQMGPNNQKLESFVVYPDPYHALSHKAKTAVYTGPTQYIILQNDSNDWGNHFQLTLLEKV